MKNNELKGATGDQNTGLSTPTYSYAHAKIFRMKIELGWR